MSRVSCAIIADCLEFEHEYSIRKYIPFVLWFDWLTKRAINYITLWGSRIDIFSVAFIKKHFYMLASHCQVTGQSTNLIFTQASGILWNTSCNSKLLLSLYNTSHDTVPPQDTRNRVTVGRLQTYRSRKKWALCFNAVYLIKANRGHVVGAVQIWSRQTYIHN